MLGNEQVRVREYPDPIPTEDELLIEIRASGICGSELHAYRGNREHPFNSGHEVTGVVLDPGRSRRFRQGDRVGVHAVWGCGECRWCVEGKYTYCDRRRGCPGSHAEQMRAPEHVLLRLPDDVPFDVGVLLTGDGLGVPVHVARRLGTRGGEVVCILGAGPIGLGNTLVQSFLGAEVIVLDVNTYRLELARQCGARHVLNPRDTDVVEAVREVTAGRLADKCIEAVGKAETLRLALSLVGKGGIVVAVGEQGEVPIPIGEGLIRSDVTLAGSWFYHYSEYPFILDLYRRGLDATRLITHRFPLREAATAFQAFAEGRTGKVILVP